MKASDFDIAKITALCKTLGGEFDQNGEDFDCSFPKEMKDMRKTFWDGIETFKKED